jgi:hypothetical protein
MCLSVTSVHQVTKQLKFQSYQFQAVHQLQKWDIWLQEFNVVIGFIILRMKGFVCSSKGYVLNGTSCIIQWSEEINFLTSE